MLLSKIHRAGQVLSIYNREPSAQQMTKQWVAVLFTSVVFSYSVAFSYGLQILNKIRKITQAIIFNLNILPHYNKLLAQLNPLPPPPFLSLFGFNFYFIYIVCLDVCLSMQYRRRQEEAVTCSWDWSSRQLWVGARNWTQFSSLGEQPVFLNTEPFLQPLRPHS